MTDSSATTVRRREGAVRPDLPAPAAMRTPRRRLAVDRLARWAVSAGGMGIIAGVLGILLFIVVQVVPLLGGAEVTPGRTFQVPALEARALLVDEYGSRGVTLDADGQLTVIDLGDGRTLESRALGTSPGGLQPIALVAGSPGFIAGTADGRALLVPVGWDVTFDSEGRRQVATILEPAIEIDLDPGRPLRSVAAALEASGEATVAATLDDGRLIVAQRSVERNAITDEADESWSRHEAPQAAPAEQLVIDASRRNLFGVAETRGLVWWRLEDGAPTGSRAARSDTPVTALALLIGGRSLVAGHEDGTLSVWFPVARTEGDPELTRIRGFAAQSASIVGLAPSERGRSFMAVDAGGGIALYHSTAERVLWTGRSPLGPPAAATLAPKGDGLWLAGPGRLAELAVDSPHPEVSLRALFGRVWYEGYPEPAHVWQSTGGSDDFEAKLSLTPLAFGTLKGTLYAMALAIPLGVLGALYTSQFMHLTLRRWVKPAVEIMAALPSVVLGFLAGLWLAPRMSRAVPALLLMLGALPLTMLLAGRLWRALPRAMRNRFPAGSETAVQLVALGAAFFGCLALGPRLEGVAFAGSFPDWLLTHTGLVLDQRNALVVAVAMGFAVIPIVFSIAEDALGNVPPSLVSGSLALGASRWQTVTRVVLPTASPGIFSAMMIGFGRAIGETMIVLMATGNTPLLDWNPFNGFRTLSANIAVEIPEAPYAGTLFRTLFLAALLLFVFTFLTNTAADLVRQRLRRRYAQL